jgi:hypothetical protein
VIALSTETDALTSLPPASPVASFEKKQDTQGQEAKNKDEAVTSLAASAFSWPPGANSGQRNKRWQDTNRTCSFTTRGTLGLLEIRSSSTSEHSR